MWVFLNDCFVSIVAHRDKPGTLMVRARFEGDLQSLFPHRADQVRRTPMNDYLFRVEVPAQEVADAMALAALSIDYDNFKASIREPWRAKTCSDVWSVMWNAQHQRDRRPMNERIRDKIREEHAAGLDGDDSRRETGWL